MLEVSMPSVNDEERTLKVELMTALALSGFQALQSLHIPFAMRLPHITRLSADKQTIFQQGSPNIQPQRSLAIMQLEEAQGKLQQLVL